MKKFHSPVLLREVIEFLSVKKDRKYIDSTLGGGGHSEEILKRGGEVLGIERDKEAIEKTRERLSEAYSGKLTIVYGNFSNIREIASSSGFERVWGILFDLGVSSLQIDEAERGFSFQKAGPLDMRMDKSLEVKASDLLNALGVRELTELFRNYGEEKNAAKIAKKIVERRKRKTYSNTSELVQSVEEALGFGLRNEKESAKANMRVFQALRIAVNDELRSLKSGILGSLDLLVPNGRIVVISFHSLEDRIVKNSFRDFSERGLGRILTEKPLTPTEEEVRLNPRARSAKLRVFERELI